MSDSYTEVTSQSWMGRIGNAIKGVFFGFIMILVMVVVLWWNEGRAVKTYKMLKEGAGSVISVSADTVLPANDGKLVHLSGKATTEDTLSDSTFGMSAQALKLLRTVEMYQWDEDSRSKEKKKLGGGTETVTEYTYAKEWSSKLIDSSKFKKSSGHQNPSSMPFNSETIYATRATVGAFVLSNGLLGQISNAQELPVSEESYNNIQDDLKAKLKIQGKGYYMGVDPSSPEIGDVRVSFRVVLPQDVSLIAQQAGESFVPWVASNGKSFERLDEGTITAAAMFEKAEAENRMLTWILRAVGFFLIAMGIGMILKPLSVVADVVPFLGNLLEVGLFVIALLGSLFISMMVISMAWIFYRPLIGIPLLVVSLGSIVALFVLKSKKTAAA